MARNLVNEAEWERKLYKRLSYRCPKELAAQLDWQLKQDGLTFAGWIKEKIEEYIGEGYYH